MKHILLILSLLLTIIATSQNIKTGELWRSKGVYDSERKFMERVKIQSFLYSSNESELHRLRTQDKMNMETGETKIFVSKDTLHLEPIDSKTFRMSEDETLIYHKNDSLTITYKDYSFSYVKVKSNFPKINIETVRSYLLKTSLIESVEGVEKMNFSYLNDGLVEVKPIGRDKGWKSEYKLINFNGYTILQGIVTAPKLITYCNKDQLEFLELDYRFEVKNGLLVRNNKQ